MSLAPTLAQAADPPRTVDPHFAIDPVADGALIAGGAGPGVGGALVLQGLL